MGCDPPSGPYMSIKTIGGQGGGKGGEIPNPKSDPPQTNNGFTIVPPPDWIAARSGQKTGYFMMQKLLTTTTIKNKNKNKNKNNTGR